VSRDKHPSDAELEAYGLGRLPPAVAARWDDHIADCAECGAKLSRLGEDSYCRLVRESSSAMDDTSFPTAFEAPVSVDVPAALRDHSRYAVAERLGGGGMGVVYKATHRMMRRTVAIKVIRPDLLSTPMAVARFRREVQAAAKLSHENIVAAFDAEETAGVHFLAMEFVDGESLEHRVERLGPMPWREACDAIRQAALGLAHAHENSMVHRDIKPANLMIEPSGRVKILDFGLAAWSSDEAAGLTHDGARVGTPAFAAPEQFPSGERVDGRADQYSLGATLVYLLTGRPPARLRPNDWPEDAPRPVRDIARRMMAQQPGERFESVAAAAIALGPFCDRSSPSEPLGSPLAPREESKRRITRDGKRIPHDASSSQTSRGLRGLRKITMGIGVAIVAAMAAITGVITMNRPAPQVGKHPDPLPILFLLPSHGLWHEDYQPFRDVIEAAGRKAIVATPGGKPSLPHAMSKLGDPDRPRPVAADMDLANIEPHHFDAIVCVGAEHAEFTSGDTPVSRQAIELLRLADKAQKHLVGVCVGQQVIGAAGLLRGKKVAKPSEYFKTAEMMGAIPQGNDNIVVDGQLITASGPPDSAAAARVLLKELGRK
jgi:serine/threonine protein kinase